jgi:hypothetical protein
MLTIVRGGCSTRFRAIAGSLAVLCDWRCSEIIDSEGQKLQYSASGAIAIERPGNFYGVLNQCGGSSGSGWPEVDPAHQSGLRAIVDEFKRRGHEVLPSVQAIPPRNDSDDEAVAPRVGGTTRSQAISAGPS